jgi:hypothetical protein
MTNFFDNEPRPEDIEEEYISNIIPVEGYDLWERSIEASPVWGDMNAEQHMQIADLYASAAYSGSFYEAEEFLDLLYIEWDNDDIAAFWELYESLAG